MLKSLTIENIALIDRIEVKFPDGLTILTGETGAGKSIIIDALGLVLGERSSSDIVRDGSERAVIEAIFAKPPFFSSDMFPDLFEPSDNRIVLRRIIAANGRSRAFVNDSPVQLSVLSALGDLLVDLHGQHDHQALLKPSRHLEYLDNFDVDADILERTAALYGEFRNLERTLSDLKSRKEGINEKRDLLSFQIKEIESVNPLAGEEEELEQTERLQKAGERIHTLSGQLTETLYEGEGSVSEKLAGAEEALQGLAQVDTAFKEWAEQCKAARIAAEEVVDGLQKFVGKHDFDASQLEFARERLGKFSLLKKKYGGSIENVKEYLEKCRTELSAIGNLDDDIAAVGKKKEETYTALLTSAAELSRAREARAAVLEKATVAVLQELGLPKALFTIDISTSDEYLSRSGCDKVEFFISLNPGEPVKPLKDVASGGEISRIMLALKTVLAESDRIPVMIFDEIDSGVSGRIARVIGRNLLKNAASRQIICITHLPQIASMGSSHYQVSKTVRGERTETRIKALAPGERVEEIAKLLGGDTVSANALESAKELLGESRW